MSHPLEERACPDCGAIFYLKAGGHAELPPHGCPAPADPAEVPAQAMRPAADPPKPARAQPAPGSSGGSPNLFHALQDQERTPQASERPVPAPQTGRAALRDDTAKVLRERGYVLTEDAHGVRITGSPRGGHIGSGLSPSDIVRIAAELDGGVKQAGMLQTCSKCQARTPAGEAKCQWCGELFPAPG